MIYRMNYKGEFRANFHPLGKCGLPGIHSYRYEIQVATDTLDATGKMFDADRFSKILDNSWNTAYSWKASSEQVIGGILNQLHRFLLGTKALSISVKVFVDEHTVIGLTWEKGEPLTDIVPEAILEEQTFKFPKGTRYAGKTLEDVPEGYILFLQRTRPNWLDETVLDNFLQKITQKYADVVQSARKHVRETNVAQRDKKR